MRRRDFLRSTGLVSASLLLPRFLKAAPMQGASGGRKLVVVQLGGGNDGLNTVVPFRMDPYFAMRPQLALHRDKVLALNDEVGLHPALPGLRGLFDAGNLTVVNGVGYPQPDRSHFRSMDIWHTASASDEYLDTGWLGRYLDERRSAPHGVIEFGGSLSLANKGARMKAIAMNEPARFYASTRDPYFAQLASAPHTEQHAQLGYLYRTMAETYQSAGYIQQRLKSRATAVVFPKTDIGKQLRQVSAFIQSGMETRVYYTSMDGFDTHVNQAMRQQKQLTMADAAITAFWNDLVAAGLEKEVLVVVFSEFGRRVKQNASNGTDHGTAGPVFLIGSSLKKPGLYNAMPAMDQLDGNGDLRFTVDFRRIYAAVLRDQLDTDPASIGLAGVQPVPILV